MELPKTYTTEEAGKLLHLSPFTVRDACRIGRLPCNRRGGRFVITEEQLQAYLTGVPYQPKPKNKKQK